MNIYFWYRIKFRWKISDGIG